MADGTTFRKWVFDTVQVLAVVGGLVFVGLEVRQNTIGSRAAAYRAVGLEAMQFYGDLARDRRMVELVARSNDPSQFAQFELPDVLQLQILLLANLRAVQAMYTQVQEGLIPPEGLERFGGTSSLESWPPHVLKRLWPALRATLDPEFVTYSEERVDALPDSTAFRPGR